MKYDKILLMNSTLIIFSLIAVSHLSYAEWQIDISLWQKDLCRTASYDSRLCNGPSKIGSFATKELCEKARYKMCFGGGRNDRYLYNRSYCVGFDSPQSYPESTQPTHRKIWHINTSQIIIRICAGETYDKEICEKPYLIGNFKTFEECESYRRVIFSGNKDYYNSSFCSDESFDPSLEEEHKRVPVREYQRKEYKKQLQSKISLEQEDFKRKKDLLYKKLEAKLSEKTRADFVSAINQLGYAAYFSLKAVDNALSGDLEMARALAGCQFDYLDSKKCPYKAEVSIKVHIPAVPPPVLDSSQAQIYKYINRKANELLNRVIENQKNLKQVNERLANIEIQLSNIKKQKEIIEKELNKSNSQESRKELLKTKQTLENEDNSLLLEAQKLYKESQEMQEASKKYKEEVERLKGIFNEVSNNPEQSDSIYKNI